MKKAKWLLCAILTLSLVASTFSGCNNSTPPTDSISGSNSADSPAQSSSTEPSKANMRFSWWGADVRHQATLAAIKAYEDANPSVKIEAEYQGFEGYQQKMMTQLAGGTAPDLIQIDNVWLMDLSSQKEVLFDDINNYSDIIDLTAFDQQIINSYCSYDGKLLGIPLGTNGSGLMVNKEFMSKHGVALDTQFTWDAVLEVGKEIHQKNPNAYLLGLDPSSESIVPLFWEPFLLGKTGEYWVSDNFEIKASEQDIVDALSMIKRLYDEGAIVPMGETISFAAKMEQLPKWVNGEIGALLDWSGRLPAIKSAVGADKFATMNPPLVKDGKITSFPTKPSLLVGINNRSENKQAAASFINWMVNTKDAAMILTDVRSIPTSTIARTTIMDAGKGDPDVLEMVNRTLENPSPAPPYAGRNAEVVSIVSEELQKVVYAQLTPEEGAEQMMTRVKAKLDSLNK